jgi:hypothetical protein
MATMLGIRFGEFEDIIRASLPEDVLIEVENRDIISPYDHQHSVLLGYSLPDQDKTGLQHVNGCPGSPKRS